MWLVNVGCILSISHASDLATYLPLADVTKATSTIGAGEQNWQGMWWCGIWSIRTPALTSRHATFRRDYITIFERSRIGVDAVRSYHFDCLKS